MFGWREPTQQPDLSVYGRDRLEIILFGDRDVHDIATVVTKPLGRRKHLLFHSRVAVDALLQHIASAGAVPELIARHVTEQLAQHRLACAPSDAEKEVCGEELRRHEVREVRRQLSLVVTDGERALARGNEGGCRHLLALEPNTIQVS